MMFASLSLFAQDAVETSSDDVLAIYILAISLVLAIICGILGSIRKKKCPECKKNFAMHEINRKSLGIVKTRNIKNPDGTYATVHDRNYQVTLQCKYCGATKSISEIEKGH